MFSGKGFENFDYMYRYLFIGILVLTSLSCQSQKAQTNINSAENNTPSTVNYVSNANVPESGEKVNELIEAFSDDLEIGVLRKNKIELSMVGQSKNTSGIELKFYSLDKNGEWKLKHRNEFESNSFRLDAQLSDFNNDGFKDLTYVSTVAARGANELRTLFIYDKAKDELVHIKNSGEYPNLLYNKKLNCLDAQSFYGGNATAFLKIEGDVLRRFALVETFGTERKVYLFDRNGKRKLLRTDKVSEEELFERYETFDPPTAYTAEELEQ